MKILFTGSSGLVGSRFSELLGYEFEDINRKAGVDITDAGSVFRKINSSDAEIVLHMAAKTDVDLCEKDKEIDQNYLNQKKPDMDKWIKQQSAWVINVIGTQNVIEACKKNNKKIIYVSTDFVFDGTKEGGYSEDDKENPVNWYGKTKYEGEQLIKKSGLNWAIARLAYPYRAKFDTKKDFFRVVLERLQNKQAVYMITDHIMTPTFADDFVYAIDKLIKNNSAGIYNVVGSQFISPFDGAVIIADKFELDKNLIFKTTREEYFKNKAPRPFFLGLKNDKIGKLGIKMRGFEEGIEEIKKQLTGKKAE